jgi:type VI secretion system protein ImpL
MKWVFNWYVLTFLAVVLIGVLIWFVGPLIAIADFEPLGGEIARIATIAIIFLIWLALAIWRVVRARRANAALQEGLAKTAEADKESAVLAKRMVEALGTLKRMGGRSGKGNYLYSRPWYMIIGPPGTGKTTALVNSGLKFLVEDNGAAQAMQGVGGTRNCDWWFTDDAILVDTAGRYTTQDSDADRDRKAWLAFLSLLRRNRPAQPLNGVMVAFGFDLLMNASVEELKSHGDAVRRRLNELHKELGVRLPVYVWFTKADILPGFVEFYDDLSADGRREVVGATWKWDGARPLDVEKLLDEFDLVVKAMTERTPTRLQNEADSQRRSRVLGFPVQVAEARVRIATFLGSMFEVRPLDPTPVFRGFYLTSGTQTGAAIDRLLGVMAPPRVQASRRGKATGRAYFLQRLMSDVMFPESGLVTADPSVRRRRRAVLIGGLVVIGLLTAGLLGLWFVAYQRNTEAQNNLQASVKPFVETAASPASTSPRSAPTTCRWSRSSPC